MSILNDLGDMAVKDFKDALVFTRAAFPSINSAYSIAGLHPDTNPHVRSFSDNLVSLGNTAFNVATLVPGVGPTLKGAKFASTGMKAGKAARQYRTAAAGYRAAGPKIGRASERFIKPYRHLANEELAQNVRKSGRIGRLDKWQGKKYALQTGRNDLQARALHYAPPTVRSGTMAGRIAAKAHKQNATLAMKNGSVRSIPANLDRMATEYSNQALFYKKKAKRKFAKALVAPAIGQYFGPE